MDVLNRILKLREERNWTEYRLSEESEIPQSTISSWFRKNIIPSVASLEKICRAYNITLSQFFAEDAEVNDLTDIQKDMLSYFCKLNEAQQKSLINFLANL